MDFEPVVMHYLAAQGLFLSPQFSIPNATVREWSCPDFVALDFIKKQAQVVEVTIADNVRNLVAKIQNRENQWFQPLKSHLLERKVIDPRWCFVVRAFVRGDRFDYVHARFKDDKDVIIERIEDVTFSWKWPWKEWA